MDAKHILGTITKAITLLVGIPLLVGGAFLLWPLLVSAVLLGLYATGMDYAKDRSDHSFFLSACLLFGALAIIVAGALATVGATVYWLDYLGVFDLIESIGGH